MFINDLCEYCERPMKSPYTFKDDNGDWHSAHKYCCNLLKAELANNRFKGEKLHPMVWCKYRVEFGCTDGRLGAYLGDTVEQVHRAIDNDSQLDEGEKSILKYGYFGEFKDKPYTTQNYVIDNGIHFFWIVRGK